MGLAFPLESLGSSPVFDYYTDISEMLCPECSWITVHPEVIHMEGNSSLLGDGSVEWIALDPVVWTERASTLD